MKPWWMLGLLLCACGTGERYEEMLQTSRVEQAVSAYEGARLRGEPLDLCVKARQVALAYEAAGKSAEQDAWHAREAADCQAAQARFAGTAPLD